MNPFELSFVQRVYSESERTILTRPPEAAKPETSRLQAAAREARCLQRHARIQRHAKRCISARLSDTQIAAALLVLNAEAAVKHV